MIAMVVEVVMVVMKPFVDQRMIVGREEDDRVDLLSVRLHRMMIASAFLIPICLSLWPRR